MSLDLNKLEKVRDLAGGIVQARCPACAEGDRDRTGEHLRIYPDGRFGCCVHPKDGAHRKRIFALAGVHQPGTFTLRIKSPPSMAATRSVRAALTAFDGGTFGTAKTESETDAPNVPGVPIDDFGTLGTAKVKLRARARVDSYTVNMDVVDFQGELKDSESVVPSVPTGERLPFLTADATLSIPFDSPERYHWWRSGQGVSETVKEVRAGLATKERMKDAAAI